MLQKEIRLLNENGGLDTVACVNKGVHWEIMVCNKNGDLITVDAVLGGVRKFKTLDAVNAIMKDMGIKSFSVC